MIPTDRDYTARTRRLDIYRRVLEGRLYDILDFEFQDERNASGEYIPLRRRKPSVRYALCRIVVDDSVALLFSEAHFPSIITSDARLTRIFADLARETRLNQVMTEAALRGSIGSVAIIMRILKSRIVFNVLDTIYLQPSFDPLEPGTLVSVTERYKVSGADLLTQGYPTSDPEVDYWFERKWDSIGEYWYLPYPTDQEASARQLDLSRTTEHRLGFVPIVWIRNLPGGDTVDGSCTFKAAIDTSIEIDYQLSQAGRGLKYSSDPTLIIKEPASPDGDLIKSAGNALVVSEKGDAKLLEIGGTAASAVIDYVKVLREFALESIHGNRADASRLTAATSGRAIEMMQQGLISLADNLRVSYGEAGLIPLLRMVLLASRKYRLRIGGEFHDSLAEEVQISLKWPGWYAATADDRMKDAQALATLASSRQISQETAMKSIADLYNIHDIEAELSRIKCSPEEK